MGALLAQRRATTTIYSAAEDTFCLQIPAAEFTRLYAADARFRDFCTDYLASLLRESHRLLGMQHASLALEQQAMNRTLRSLIRREPIACAPETSLESALSAMHAARVGSVAVVDPKCVPQGILTRHDVLGRVVLARQNLASPIAAVMTRNLHTLPAEATAYDAVRLIAQHGVRHVPVVDEDKLIGIVTERDLFSLQRIGVRAINRTIAQAGDEARLQHAAADIRALARSLFEQGVAAEPLTLLISGLNDALARRIVGLERDRHALEGIEWCWLAFGSEGRHQQTLSTDQDNGLLFAAPSGESAEQVRLRLPPFAEAVNRISGCVRLSALQGQHHGVESALVPGASTNGGSASPTGSRTQTRKTPLNAAIFFDFRALHGDDALARASCARRC